MNAGLSAGLAEHVADIVIVLCGVYACDPFTLVPLTIWGRNDGKVGAGQSSGQRTMRTMWAMEKTKFYEIGKAWKMFSG